VALNRQPTGNQAVKHWGKINRRRDALSPRSAAILNATPPKKEKRFPPPSVPNAGRNEGETWDR